MWKPVVGFVSYGTPFSDEMDEVLFAPFVTEVGGELKPITPSGQLEGGRIDTFLRYGRLVAIVVWKHGMRDYEELRQFADSNGVRFYEIERDSDSAPLMLSEIKSLVENWRCPSYPLGTESALDEAILVRSLMANRESATFGETGFDSPVDYSSRLALEAMRYRLTPVSLIHAEYDERRVQANRKKRDVGRDEIVARRFAKKVRRMTKEQRQRFFAGVNCQMGRNADGSGLLKEGGSISRGSFTCGVAVAEDNLMYVETSAHEMAMEKLKSQLDILSIHRSRTGLSTCDSSEYDHPISRGYLVEEVRDVPVQVALLYTMVCYGRDGNVISYESRKPALLRIRDFFLARGIVPIDKKGFIYGER